MNWHKLIGWQIESFGGNPAVMVEVTSGTMDSAIYTGEQIVSRGLIKSIQPVHCMDEESEMIAAIFKDGGISFAFINGKHTYEDTIRHLKAWYPKVHYNSLMAGSGLDNPEVKRAVDDFCKDAGVPWREFLPGVWAVHHCHRMGQ